MDTFDTIYQRQAIEHYDLTHKLTDVEIEKILQAAIQSPSSFNMQNRRFVLATEPALRKQIRAAAYDQAQVTDASC